MGLHCGFLIGVEDVLWEIVVGLTSTDVDIFTVRDIFIFPDKPHRHYRP